MKTISQHAIKRNSVRHERTGIPMQGLSRWQVFLQPSATWRKPEWRALCVLTYFRYNKWRTKLINLFSCDRNYIEFPPEPDRSILSISDARSPTLAEVGSFCLRKSRRFFIQISIWSFYSIWLSKLICSGSSNLEKSTECAFLLFSVEQVNVGNGQMTISGWLCF